MSSDCNFNYDARVIPCSVCLEELAADVFLYSCGHVIHRSCHEDFILGSKRGNAESLDCPACRATISINDIVQLKIDLAAEMVSGTTILNESIVMMADEEQSKIIDNKELTFESQSDSQLDSLIDNNDLATVPIVHEYINPGLFNNIKVMSSGPLHANTKTTNGLRHLFFVSTTPLAVYPELPEQKLFKKYQYFVKQTEYVFSDTMHLAPPTPLPQHPLPFQLSELSTEPQLINASLATAMNIGKLSTQIKNGAGDNDSVDSFHRASAVHASHIEKLAAQVENIRIRQTTLDQYEAYKEMLQGTLETQRLYCGYMSHNVHNCAEQSPSTSLTTGDVISQHTIFQENTNTGHSIGMHTKLNTHLQHSILSAIGAMETILSAPSHFNVQNLSDNPKQPNFKSQPRHIAQFTKQSKNDENNPFINPLRVISKYNHIIDDDSGGYAQFREKLLQEHLQKDLLLDEMLLLTTDVQLDLHQSKPEQIPQSIVLASESPLTASPSNMKAKTKTPPKTDVIIDYSRYMTYKDWPLASNTLPIPLPPVRTFPNTLYNPQTDLQNMAIIPTNADPNNHLANASYDDYNPNSSHHKAHGHAYWASVLSRYRLSTLYFREVTSQLAFQYRIIATIGTRHMKNYPIDSIEQIVLPKGPGELTFHNIPDILQWKISMGNSTYPFQEFLTLIEKLDPRVYDLPEVIHALNTDYLLDKTPPGDICLINNDDSLNIPNNLSNDRLIADNSDISVNNQPNQPSYTQMLISAFTNAFEIKALIPKTTQYTLKDALGSYGFHLGGSGFDTIDWVYILHVYFGNIQPQLSPKKQTLLYRPQKFIKRRRGQAQDDPITLSNTVPTLTTNPLNAHTDTLDRKIINKYLHTATHFHFIRGVPHFHRTLDSSFLPKDAISAVKSRVQSSKMVICTCLSLTSCHCGVTMRFSESLSNWASSLNVHISTQYFNRGLFEDRHMTPNIMQLRAVALDNEIIMRLLPSHTFLALTLYGLGFGCLFSHQTMACVPTGKGVVVDFSQYPTNFLYNGCEHSLLLDLVVVLGQICFSCLSPSFTEWIAHSCVLALSTPCNATFHEKETKEEQVKHTTFDYDDNDDYYHNNKSNHLSQKKSQKSLRKSLDIDQKQHLFHKLDLPDLEQLTTHTANITRYLESPAVNLDALLHQSRTYLYWDHFSLQYEKQKHHYDLQTAMTHINCGSLVHYALPPFIHPNYRGLDHFGIAFYLNDEGEIAHCIQSATVTLSGQRQSNLSQTSDQPIRIRSHDNISLRETPFQLKASTNSHMQTPLISNVTLHSLADIMQQSVAEHFAAIETDLRVGEAVSTPTTNKQTSLMAQSTTKKDPFAFNKTISQTVLFSLANIVNDASFCIDWLIYKSNVARLSQYTAIHQHPAAFTPESSQQLISSRLSAEFQEVIRNLSVGYNSPKSAIIPPLNVFCNNTLEDENISKTSASNNVFPSQQHHRATATIDLKSVKNPPETNTITEHYIEQILSIARSIKDGENVLDKEQHIYGEFCKILDAVESEPCARQNEDLFICTQQLNVNLQRIQQVNKQIQECRKLSSHHDFQDKKDKFVININNNDSAIAEMFSSSLKDRIAQRKKVAEARSRSRSKW